MEIKLKRDTMCAHDEHEMIKYIRLPWLVASISKEPRDYEQNQFPTLSTL